MTTTKDAPDEPAAEIPDAETDTALRHTAYDDESDLALPTHDPDTETAFVPYSGSAVYEQPGAAYDVGRDVGL